MNTSKHKRHQESPEAIAMRLAGQLGAERALEVCDGISESRYPMSQRIAYRNAARILAAAIEDQE